MLIIQTDVLCLSGHLQVIGMPTSYLISPDGEVKLVHMGFRNGDMDIIEAAVKEVLEGN